MLKLLILLTFMPISLLADSNKPLYEIGALMGFADTPHYPGSSKNSTNYIIFPSFIYRGDIFRSDDKGTRARLFTSDRIDLDLSFGFSFPADANENPARDGMDDLDLLIEIGPRLSYLLYKESIHEWEIELPIRTVTSTDFQFTRQRGLRFQPQIDYRIRPIPRFTFVVGTKFNYGSEPLNDYFYEVKTTDVSDSRERYNARAGYIGQDLNFFAMYLYEDLFVIFGYKKSYYDNTTNKDSPLFSVKENESIFFAVNYFFFKSDEKAPKDNYTRTPLQ